MDYSLTQSMPQWVYRSNNRTLKKDFTINSETNFGASALYFASQNGHTEVVTKLTRNGANNNLQDKEQWSDLHIASQNGHVEVVRAFST